MDPFELTEEEAAKATRFRSFAISNAELVARLGLPPTAIITHIGRERTDRDLFTIQVHDPSCEPVREHGFCEQGTLSIDYVEEPAGASPQQ